MNDFPIPGTFFTIEIKRALSSTGFETKTHRFNKEKAAKSCWFEGRTQSSFNYGVARRHFRKKNENRSEISIFQRIRTSVAFRWYPPYLQRSLYRNTQWQNCSKFNLTKHGENRDFLRHTDHPITTFAVRPLHKWRMSHNKTIKIGR